MIVVKTDDQPDTAKRVIQGGAQAIIIKPVMPDLLEVALMKANLRCYFALNLMRLLSSD